MTQAQVHWVLHSFDGVTIKLIPFSRSSFKEESSSLYQLIKLFHIFSSEIVISICSSTKSVRSSVPKCIILLGCLAVIRLVQCVFLCARARMRSPCIGWFLCEIGRFSGEASETSFIHTISNSLQFDDFLNLESLMCGS